MSTPPSSSAPPAQPPPAQIETLLFCPGQLCDERLFQHQLTHFRARYADVRVAGRTSESSIEATARALLESAPGRFAVVGLSMGGYLALELYRLTPARVAAMALLSTQATADNDEVKANRRARITRAQEGGFDEIVRELPPRMLWSGRRRDRELISVVLKMGKRTGPQAYVLQQLSNLGRRDQTPMLGMIRCPVLVLVGEQDRVTPPEHADVLANAIPRANLVVLAECGHLPTLERPAEVTAALDGWLARAAPPVPLEAAASVAAAPAPQNPATAPAS